jgi:hypothetical protein
MYTKNYIYIVYQKLDLYVYQNLDLYRIPKPIVILYTKT